MIVTLQQIADEAGVDRATASRVLSGKAVMARISRERIERVTAVALRLNYRKNVAAKAISTGKLGAVDLVLSRGDDTSTTPIQMQVGIHDSLARHDLRMQMSWLSDDQFTNENFLPFFLREHSADGILLNYTHHIPPQLRDMVKKYALPTIWLNSRHPADCICPDDLGGAELVTRHLIQTGRKRIAYLDYCHNFNDPDVHYSAIDRMEGYRRAMKEAGLEPTIHYRPKDPPRAGWVTAIRALLENPNRPDAIISYGHENEIVSIECLRMGIKLPQDMTLAVFGDVPARFAGQSVITVLLQHYDIGASAVDMLMQKLEHPKVKLAARKVPCLLDLGDDPVMLNS